jgi:hypothetical protein
VTGNGSAFFFWLWVWGFLVAVQGSCRLASSCLVRSLSGINTQSQTRLNATRRGCESLRRVLGLGLWSVKRSIKSQRFKFWVRLGGSRVVWCQPKAKVGLGMHTQQQRSNITTSTHIINLFFFLLSHISTLDSLVTVPAQSLPSRPRLAPDAVAYSRLTELIIQYSPAAGSL